MIDHVPSPGLSTRFGKGIRVPSPKNEPEKALNALLKAAGEGPKGILFPSSDFWVQFASQHRRELGERYEIILPSEEVSRGLTNKRFQQDEAERLGIPLAKTFYPKHPADIEELRDDLQYPVFIKPYSGHLWRMHFPNKGFRADGPEELSSIFGKIFPLDLEAMVQEIVVGPNTNHFEVSIYIDHLGTMRGVFTAQKIRQYPVDFGMGTLLMSVHNPEAEELASKLLNGMGHRGIADVEFKLDERDGRYKMLDINSRFWFQTIQATCAGINFPLIQYLDLTGQKMPEAPQQRDGVYWINPMSDVLSIISRPRRKGDLRRAITPYFEAEGFSYFAKDDLMPAIKKLTSRDTLSNLLFKIDG
ncbi:MAG: ATP-grasp domain-containing protein [Methanomassiliicoccus sp.]|nr:ATP-grasp domain-containing protein [Methanomassiliicoccus sp.]